MIHEVRRRIRHPSSTTGIANRSFLTREGNDAVQAARIAVDANEAPPKHAAFEELAELALH